MEIPAYALAYTATGLIAGIPLGAFVAAAGRAWSERRRRRAHEQWRRMHRITLIRL